MSNNNVFDDISFFQFVPDEDYHSDYLTFKKSKKLLSIKKLEKLFKVNLSDKLNIQLWHFEEFGWKYSALYYKFVGHRQKLFWNGKYIQNKHV